MHLFLGTCIPHPPGCCSLLSAAGLQTCFGRVMTAGRAAGAGPWGASVAYMPWVQGICLDLLPPSWQNSADLQQVRLACAVLCCCWCCAVLCFAMLC